MRAFHSDVTASLGEVTADTSTRTMLASDQYGSLCGQEYSGLQRPQHSERQASSTSAFTDALTDAPKDAARFLAFALTRHANTRYASGMVSARSLLGIESSGWDGDTLSQWVEQHPAKGLHISLAVVFAGFENTATREWWRTPDANSRGYLNQLAAWGHSAWLGRRACHGRYAIVAGLYRQYESGLVYGRYSAGRSVCPMDSWHTWMGLPMMVMFAKSAVSPSFWLMPPTW